MHTYLLCLALSSNGESGVCELAHFLGVYFNQLSYVVTLHGHINAGQFICYSTQVTNKACRTLVSYILYLNVLNIFFLNIMSYVMYLSNFFSFLLFRHIFLYSVLGAIISTHLMFESRKMEDLRNILRP